MQSVRIDYDMAQEAVEGSQARKDAENDETGAAFGFFGNPLVPLR